MPGLDAQGEMSAQFSIRHADQVESGFDRFGYRQARAIGMGGALAISSAKAHRPGNLVFKKFHFMTDFGYSARIIVLFGRRQRLAEIFKPAFVLRRGGFVQGRAGVAEVAGDRKRVRRLVVAIAINQSRRGLSTSDLEP